MDFLSNTPELNYMTQINIMMFEDPTKDWLSPEKLHVELHFSPGAYTSFEKDVMGTPGSGYRPTICRLGSMPDFLSGKSSIEPAVSGIITQVTKAIALSKSIKEEPLTEENEMSSSVTSVDNIDNNINEKSIEDCLTTSVGGSAYMETSVDKEIDIVEKSGTVEMATEMNKEKNLATGNEDKVGKSCVKNKSNEESLLCTGTVCETKKVDHLTSDTAYDCENGNTAQDNPDTEINGMTDVVSEPVDMLGEQGCSDDGALAKTKTDHIPHSDIETVSVVVNTDIATDAVGTGTKKSDVVVTCENTPDMKRKKKKFFVNVAVTPTVDFSSDKADGIGTMKNENPQSNSKDCTLSGSDVDGKNTDTAVMDHLDFTDVFDMGDMDVGDTMSEETDTTDSDIHESTTTLTSGKGLEESMSAGNSVPLPKSPDPLIPEWDWDDATRDNKPVTGEDVKSVSNFAQRSVSMSDPNIPTSQTSPDSPSAVSQPKTIANGRRNSFEEKRSRSLEEQEAHSGLGN